MQGGALFWSSSKKAAPSSAASRTTSHFAFCSTQRTSQSSLRPQVMKLSLLWLGLGLVAPSQAMFVVKSSDVAPPADVLGEHQSLETSWTIYSTNALTSLTFQGSGTVFVAYDASLQVDPAPAIPDTPSNSDSEDPPASRHGDHVPPEPPRAPPAPPSVRFEPPAPPSPPMELFAVDDGSSEGSSSDANETNPVAPVASLQAIAKIVVSGDSKELLSSFTIITSDSSEDNGLELTVSSSSAKKGGYALTQLFVVAKSSLTRVKAIASGDVVIGENVLVTNSSAANVTLSSVGSGDIFVTSNESLAIESLEVFTAGSGDVQLEFATVSAGAIKLSGVASGDIALLADQVDAESITTLVVGSADLYIQAANVNVTTLDTFLGGSGSATLSKSGACVNQTVTVAGSGKVKTGSIACENVDVSIFGSGDALVRAANNLSVTLVASGSVEYVDEEPTSVVVKGAVFRKNLAHHVKHVDKNKFHVHKRHHAPSCKPHYVKGKKTHHRGFHWWNIFGGHDDSDDDDDDSDSDMKRDSGKHHFKITFEDGSGGEQVEIGDFDDDTEPQVMNLAASTGSATSRAPSAASIVGVFGVAMGVVGFAAYKIKQRRARKQYIPLF